MTSVRLVVLLGALTLVGCAARDASAASGPVPAPAVDEARAAKSETRSAVFAGGCFWCVEAVFEAVEGVISAESGYAGDTAANAKYDLVGAGRTRHAEVVRVVYDGSKTTYGELLQILFVTSEPTVKDRQGPDVGRQYRFAVFPADAQQKNIVDAYIAQLTAAKVYSAPIVATVEPLEAFYAAEAYHQDFVRLHPQHPYVRAWSVPKMQKLLRTFPERVRRAPAQEREPAAR